MDIESRIQAWAQSHPALRAVIVVGSRARTEHPADEWSDLDLCLFATDVQQFANSEFYRAFGEVWLSAFETISQGTEPEWIVMYAGGLKVDFTFIPTDAATLSLAEALARAPHTDTFARGLRVLVDKYPRTDHTPPLTPSAPLPDEAEFLNTINHFLMAATRAVKFIRRGDHWRATTITMFHMRKSLLRLLEWHARALHGADYDTWYDGRFVEDWGDPRAVVVLKDLYADDDPVHRAKAALTQVRLFMWLAREIADLLGYGLPPYTEVLQWIETQGKHVTLLPTDTQVSAGGVVYRPGVNGIEIAMVRAGSRWQLPKGTIEDGEDTETTARREVREEAGLTTEVLGLIDRIEYWYYTSAGRGKKRIHKFVYFYLMRYVSGDTADHDHEVDEARWFPLEQVEALVPFRGEAAILAKARALIAADHSTT